MKTKLTILTLLSGLMTLSAVAANAAPGAAISITNNTGKSTWVTIYNFAESIRDSGCVNPGETKTFYNYFGPIQYSVRGEVTQGARCGGNVISDSRVSVSVPLNVGADVSVEQDVNHHYYLQKH